MVRKAGFRSEIFQIPIEGKVTSCMVGELREAILSAIVQAHEIEIDLLQVAEIDFTGLLLMVETKLAATSQGKTLNFIGYSRPVAEILGMSGLTEFFCTPRLDKESILLLLDRIPNYMGERK